VNVVNSLVAFDSMTSIADVHREDVAGRQIVVEGSYLLKPAFGIHKVVVGLIDWLADLLAEVTVVLPGPLPDTVVRRDGVDYVVLPMISIGRHLAYEQLSIPKYLKKSAAEIYLAPANRGVPIRGVSQRTVLIIHDMIPFISRDGESFIADIGLAPHRWAIRSSVRRATQVVSVSASAQSDLLQQRGRTSTLGYPPLSNLNVYCQDALGRESFFIFTGGLSARKNLKLTLEAFSEFRLTHPEFELRVTGDTNPKMFSEHFGPELMSGVVLTGRLSNEALLAMVRRCAAVVYPSQYEGKGLPIIDALATSKPIICGTGGSQVEVAGAAGLFVDPITKETLLTAMESALHLDQDQFQVLAANQFKSIDGPEWEQGLLQALFAERRKR
jgi:glycosyltransferase involved in cell wall biosynthesis